MREAYIALGANTGDRLAALRRAAERLVRLGAEPLRASRIYETAPMYLDAQPPFLNAVVALPTVLDAETLLRGLLRIETELGRVRTERFGPRAIDLDLIAVGAEVHESALLTLPHPLLQERPFVLFPLCDVAPHWRHPRLEKSAEALRDALVVAEHTRPAALDARLVAAGGEERAWQE